MAMELRVAVLAVVAALVVILIAARAVFPRRRSRTRRRATAQEVRQWRRSVESAPVALTHGSTVLSGEAWVCDGDTIQIGDYRIRLFGIDAPELDDPHGREAKAALIQLCRKQVVTAHFEGTDPHARNVARCLLPDGRDLSAEMVRAGLAIDWPKHSGGRYRHLEPAGVRDRLARCHQRQQPQRKPQARPSR